MTNELMQKLQLKVPLIVAPMAGGPSSPALVIASSEAGALGSIGAAYSTPQAIKDFAQNIRAQTTRPFAINLFVPHAAPLVSQKHLDAALAATREYRTELKLAEPNLTSPYEENFDAQFEAMLRVKPAVFSFVFGDIGVDHVTAAKKEKIFVIGTATSLKEAKELEASGVDAVTLQGIEGGGHRGLFDATADDHEMKLADLLKIGATQIKIPLIAAGGLMTSQDIRAALSAGAQAVQMGTAFLVCKEAGTSAPYRTALLKTNERKTKTTRVFSGRFARGLENRFMTEMEAKGPTTVLPFPAQNKFTRDLRTASAAQGLPDFLSLWSGTGQGELWQGSCATLIARLFEEIIA